MTEFSCGYGDDRDAAIVAFLYDEPDANPAERSSFEAHLRTCARCQADIASLRQVRAHLGRWSPPEPSFAIHNSQSTIQNPQPAIRNPEWSWRAIPVWAQVAAALLFQLVQRFRCPLERLVGPNCPSNAMGRAEFIRACHAVQPARPG